MTQSDTAQPGPGGGDVPAPRHVGEVLRRRREERGYTLADLAATLRIRQPYLDAIEQGRWHELPGHAYTSGFLRTYATTVGLEPGPILSRFKQETAGTEQPAELYFPEAADESRVPGGALIIVALLLAGVAYGGWYALSNSDRNVVETVQELPARMAGLIPGGTEPPEPAPEPEPAQVLPPTQVEELIGQSQPTAPEVGASNAPAGPGAPMLPPDAPSLNTASQIAADPAADVAAEGEESETVELPPDLSVSPTVDADGRPVESPAPEPTVNAAAPVQPPAQEPAVQQPTGSAPAAEPPVADADTPPAAGPAQAEDAAEPPAETAAAPEPPAQPPASGRVFGQTEGQVRVTVRAVEDSWVEIRDARGTLWAARNLRPGDTFRAPDVPGLALSVVGNAAGVVVNVDGQDLPPLDGRGRVVRNVSLVPGDLLERLNQQGGQG